MVQLNMAHNYDTKNGIDVISHVGSNVDPLLIVYTLGLGALYYYSILRWRVWIAILTVPLIFNLSYKSLFKHRAFSQQPTTFSVEGTPTTSSIQLPTNCATALLSLSNYPLLKACNFDNMEKYIVEVPSYLASLPTSQLLNFPLSHSATPFLLQKQVMSLSFVLSFSL